MRIIALTLSCIGLVISGCNTSSSSFACPGMPNGVTCMSAKEVYKATNNADSLGGRTDKSSDSSQSDNNSKSARNTAGPALPIPAIDKPVPIRSQAKVLRVWYAPYQDENGDLNVPGYAYTEIEPRRWNMGENLVIKKRSSEPLNVKVNRPSNTDQNFNQRPADSSSTNVMNAPQGFNGLPQAFNFNQPGR